MTQSAAGQNAGQAPVDLKTNANIYFCWGCCSCSGRARPQSRFIPGGENGDNTIETPMKCSECDCEYTAVMNA